MLMQCFSMYLRGSYVAASLDAREHKYKAINCSFKVLHYHWMGHPQRRDYALHPLSSRCSLSTMTKTNLRDQHLSDHTLRASNCPSVGATQPTEQELAHKQRSPSIPNIPHQSRVVTANHDLQFFCGVCVG